ncbi:hypothetical protein V8J88_06385 [Massilia sp. W12]|uniref:hypothetical protein n=1 Tax=Massilia sp. W12 TaxID=3126507 RepID=UPI0030CB42A9
MFQIEEKSPPQIQPVIQRHADDAAFYWSQRDAHRASPLMPYARFVQFDRLLQAHLDGVMLAGECAWDMAWKNLQRWRGAGECFVAGMLLLHTAMDAAQKRSRFDALCAMLRQDDDLLRGMASAIAWQGNACLQWLPQWLSAQAEPILNALALHACALLRAPAPDLMPWFDHDAPQVRAAAARCAGVSLARQWQWQLQALARDEDANVRMQAIKARLLHLQTPNATHDAALLDLAQQELLACNQSAQGKGLRAVQAADAAQQLAGMLGQVLAPGSAQLGSLSRAIPLRQFCYLLACHGDPANLPWLVQACAHQESARAAGAALHMISGIDLERAGWSAAAPSEDDSMAADRARPLADPDAGLPWPDVAAVQSGLPHMQAALAGQAAVLCGMPKQDPEAMRQVLQQGRMAARQVAAWSLLRTGAAYYPRLASSSVQAG